MVPSILCYVMKFEEIRRQAALSSPTAGQTRVRSRIAALCRWGGSLYEATAMALAAHPVDTELCAAATAVVESKVVMRALAFMMYPSRSPTLSTEESGTLHRHDL